VGEYPNQLRKNDSEGVSLDPKRVGKAGEEKI